MSNNNEEDSSWEQDLNRVKQKFNENIELRAPNKLLLELLTSIGKLHSECTALYNKNYRLIKTNEIPSCPRPAMNGIHNWVPERVGPNERRTGKLICGLCGLVIEDTR